MRIAFLGNERRIDHTRRVRHRCRSIQMRCFAIASFIQLLWIDETTGIALYPNVDDASFTRSLVTETNITVINNATNNTSINTNGNNQTTQQVPINDSFCVPPNETSWATPYQSCKMESETWKELVLRNVSSNQSRRSNETQSNSTSNEPSNDSWTGECGPQCRPSCITLLLDLDRLRTDDILCPSGISCGKSCEHISQSTCRSNESEALYQHHPNCFLEEAQCYGPTIYEDIAAFYESRLPTRNGNFSFPTLDHCMAVPVDDFYHRFQGWNIISPIDRWHGDCDSNTTNANCFNRTSKIYFEYCNVVEEDRNSCRSCKASSDASCLDNQQCPKIIQPFPDGWTTFVVSASIPYPDTESSCRRDFANNGTGVELACFLQRIQLYYPPSCPHCHTCPQIGLGDTFGPLEVVGFGHAIQQNCAPCHRPSLQSNQSAQALSCQAIGRCHELVNCRSGSSLGLPSFVDNQCSFQVDVDEDFTDDILTPPPETDFPTWSPTTDAPVIITILPSLSPFGSNSGVDQNDTLPENQTAMPDEDRSSDVEDPPASSQKNRLSPLVVSLITMAMFFVIAVQLILYRKLLKQRDPPRRIAEEIVYIEPLEFDGLDKILGSDAGSDHTAADEDPTVDSDTDNPSSAWNPPWRNGITPEKLQQEIRHFQTASILERSDQNEVEALYMTGQHHIQLTS